MLPMPLWQITALRRACRAPNSLPCVACLAMAVSVTILASYVQMQAATAAAATTKATLQQDKSALESRLQDNAAACAALEAKVEFLYKELS